MTARRAEDLSFEEIKNLVRRQHPLILEIGANNSHSTNEFLSAFPTATIHCFEPDHRAIKRWYASCKDQDRATLHEMAIGAETGTAVFNMSDGRESEYEGGYYGSGSLRPPVSRNHAWLRFDRTVEVVVNRLDDWVAANIPNQTIDFIWADVQGAEVDLINGAREALRRTRFFFTEFNDRESYVGQIPLRKIVEMLADDFEIECVFRGDVLLRNKWLEPKKILAVTHETAGAEVKHTTRKGPDGQPVDIPIGHTYRSGPDGRIVPIPPGHTFRAGRDGRMVAIGMNESFRQGRDGRMIAIPKGWKTSEDESGRLFLIAPK